MSKVDVPPAVPPVEYEEGKIVVSIRCRPFNTREHDLQSVPCLEFHPAAQSVTIYEKGLPKYLGPEFPKAVEDTQYYPGKVHNFAFDHSYDSSVPQETVFRDIGIPLLEASFRGFNTCIFAYGQTGSGKSYAMMGPGGGQEAMRDPGIIPRLCRKIFEDIQQKVATNSQAIATLQSEAAAAHELPPKLSAHVGVSYLEIYQEKVRCLLNPKNDNLKVRQHPVIGVYVEGLTEVDVDSVEKILSLVEGGNNARHTAAHHMNERSSRSHAIFMVNLVQTRESITQDGTETKTELRAKINLVDLAGSERAKATGAEGDTLREGANINKSLTTLGLVISALADTSKLQEQLAAEGSPTTGSTTGLLPAGRKMPFIPYRDSMLTFLLKESLGGNSKTFMLSTLSPAHVNYEETLSTLRYADRAKAIVTKACVNETAGDKKIRELESEVLKLREMIRNLQAKGLVESSALLPTMPDHPSSSSSSVSPTVPNGPGLIVNRLLRTASTGASRTTMGVTCSTSSNKKKPVLSVRDAPPRGAGLLTANQPAQSSNEKELMNEPGSELGDLEEVGTRANLNSMQDLEARLLTTVSLIGQLSVTDAQKQLESTKVLQGLKHFTVKVHRQEPYLMNIDNAGDWVMEHLVDEVTYLGTEILPAPLINSRSVLVTGVGIGPQHCCFLKPPGRPSTILLRPLPGYTTYLNDNEEPIDGDTVLQTGCIVCIGEEYIQFKFIDPNAKGLTPRGRPRPSSVGTKVRPSVEPHPTVGRGNARASLGTPSGSSHRDPPVLMGHVRTPSSPRHPAPRPPRSPLIPQGSTTGGSPAGDLGKRIIASSLTAPATRPVTARASSAAHFQRPPVSRLQAAPSTADAYPFNPLHVTGEQTTVYRHTFVFLGPMGSGKTLFRRALQKKENFFASLLHNTFGHHADKKDLAPTFGMERSYLERDACPPVEMSLVELGGNPCFHGLRELLPNRRATYIITFKLSRATPLTLQPFRKTLEFILCQTMSNDITLVLLGTHRDQLEQLDDQAVIHMLRDLETQFHNFLRMLQVVPEKRPSIVASFAVSTTQRTVLAPNSSISSIADIVKWMADTTILRCRTDLEFPNCLIPTSLMALSHSIQILRSQGKWYMPISEYKRFATQELSTEARHAPTAWNVAELHRVTPLLQSWGLLHHHHRHMVMRGYIVLDMVWVIRLMSCLCACVPIDPLESDDTGDAVERTVQPKPHHTVRPRLPSIVHDAALATRYCRLPFNTQELSELDPLNLVEQGILSSRMAVSLFFNLLAEKSFNLQHLSGVLEMLENYDLLIVGSRLLFSSFNSLRERKQAPMTTTTTTTTTTGPGGEREVLYPDLLLTPDTEAGMVQEERNKLSPQHPANTVLEVTTTDTDTDTDAVQEMIPETFYLIPSCFHAQASSAVTLNLSDILMGPSYRFSMSMLPESFFSRFVTRISRYAKKIYFGPCYNKEGAPPLEVISASLWESSAWLLNSGSSRALFRMVHHSLFVTFHDYAEDSEFHDGVRNVIHKMISENPGVLCEEDLLCRRSYETDEDSYWHPVDDTLEGYDKVLCREQSALQTAQRLRRGDPNEASGNCEGNSQSDGNLHEPIPLIRSQEGEVTQEALLQKLFKGPPLSKEVTDRVKASVALLAAARQLPNREHGRLLEGRAMDSLVDALAHA